MRYLWIGFVGLVLLVPVACDSGDDTPGRDVPHTVPPASIASPTEVVPHGLKPVEGTGPVYET